MSTRAATLTGPRAALRFGWMGVVGLSLALGGAFGLSRATAAQEPLVVTAGGGEGTAVVNAFLPGALTVQTGSSVSFLVGSNELQTITLGEGPADVAPDLWPVSGWPDLLGTTDDPSRAVGAEPVDLGVVSWGDSGFLNTGPLSVGSTAEVRFDASGTFEVESVLHPGMTALVTVVDPGTAPVTTLDEAEQGAAATLADLLGREAGLRESSAAQVESITAADGTTTWNIFADAATVAMSLPGGGTGYLELLEFVPATLVIEPGDTVHWSARGRHTVTFPALGQDPATLDPVAPATTDETYDGTRLASSGPLNAAVGSPSGFTLTVPTAGTFGYVCLDHAGEGHVGTIQVGAPTASEPPAASPDAAPSAPASPAA
jgi:plastocyanin